MTFPFFKRRLHVACLLAGVALMPLQSFAQKADANGNSIKIDKVILSTAGLADYEYRAHVTGDATLHFPVRLDQVDDILKSLVVFDAKGRLGGVTLPGRQPLEQIFRDMPFNQGQLSNPVMLLNAYQGASVTVKTADGSFTGTIVQVKPEQTVTDKGMSQTRNRLTLMTADGLRGFIIEDLISLQFDDAKIKDELNKALAAIRENGTQGQRNLAVTLKGEGAREVALSYVVNAPVWKSAYKMVLPETGGDKDKGLLQGSAVIENQTAGDWKDVDLTLVSGNPVTFRQSLYQSYYVERPEIPVQVFGRVMPKMDEGVVSTAAELQKTSGGAAMRRGRADGGFAKGMMANAPAAAPMMAMAMDAAAPPMPAMEESLGMAGDASMVANSSAMAQAANAAQSSEATSQVLFRFPDRFDLGAGQTLMVPFVSHEVPMLRVSVYQPETHPTHPLAAVELTNDAETALPPGVLTLYEDSDLVKGTAFVGDAQMPAIAAGEKRLIPYALDSKVKISRNDKDESREGRFTIAHGVLRASQVVRHDIIYSVAAPEKEDRLVILEAPKQGDYKVVAPDPKDVEITDKEYRLRVPMKAGEKKTVTLSLENTVWNEYGIISMPTDMLLTYVGRTDALDAKTRKVFENLAAIRRDMDALDQKASQLENEKQNIFNDQSRVRENLQSLDGKSDIQQKYLNKLNAQEDRIADIDAEVGKLRQQRAARENDLREAVNDMPDSGE